MTWWIVRTFWILAWVVATHSLPASIHIGALFTEDQKDSASEWAFKYAVHKINQDPDILVNTTLVYDIQYIPKDDSFHATKKACKQVQMGVQAIFGPSDPILGSYIQSVCDALDIPHLEARMDLEPSEWKEISINLHPSQALLNQAFQDVMEFLNWSKIAIIYEEDHGLLKMQNIIQSAGPKGVELFLRQASPENYREILKDIKGRDVHNLIVDTRSENMIAFLKAILQLQMNDYKYHYLFTTFDVELFNLEDFKYNFVNITAFRIVDSDYYKVIQTLKDMEKFQPYGSQMLNRSRIIQAETALVYDSVYVFALGLQSLDRSSSLRITNVSCEDEKPWSDGSSLFNYINAVEHRGLTGPIQFKEGKRTNLKLDLLKLKAHALVKVGEWTRTSRVNITDPAAFYDAGTMNVTLMVITNLERPYIMFRHGKNYTGNSRFYGFCVDLLDEVSRIVGFNYIMELNQDGLYGMPNPVTGEWNGIVKQLITNDVPYVMLRTDVANLTGNQRFEGFCIDMLEYIAHRLGFNYVIELCPDARYGIYNAATGEWNGIVRQLINKRADLAVGSMTINYARESVIDFTKPFMNLGISILFKVPKREPARLFSFMNPLTIEIWLCVLIAYVLVSITLFIVARFSPYEWHNPHPCISTVGVVENQFSLSNSFYFTVGTLMQQGSDLNPKATSTRIVGGMWWFFTLIIFSSYTANLAAFFTVERMITPIESVQDLADQNEIAYGIADSGSTMTFFTDSKVETYQKMWRYMENKKPSVFAASYEEGVRRVLQGNYAFLMESPILDYFVQRNCNLTQVGSLIDSKGYGIATPKGSPWRDKISLAILELQEKGTIQVLYNKWWRTGDVCNRRDKTKESKANALGVDNIGGVFVVLLCGLAFAVLIAILEFCWNSRQNAVSEQQSLCAEMSEEFCFALKCSGSRTRPAFKRKCSKCVSSATYVSNSMDLGPVSSPNGLGKWDDWNDNQEDAITSATNV